MNEKKYTLAGTANSVGPVLLVNNQTLFQSLFLILSQLEQLDLETFRIVKNEIEYVADVTVEDEEKLREELLIMIDYDESDEFMDWMTEFSDFLSTDQHTYVLARLLEHLYSENNELCLNQGEFKLSVFDEFEFAIDFSTITGLYFFAKIEEGGQN
jgi:hypothetical protein